jgi:hypothetical protein
LLDSSFVNFSVTADKASANANRFYLVFRAAAGPVAVSVVSMNAYPKDGNVFIEWKTENESDVKNYEVEYSKDGIHFSKTGMVNSKEGLSNSYLFIHHEAQKGNNFYRIKINKSNGGVEYEKVIKVFISEHSPSIKIYPNPVKEGIIKVQFINQPKGKYRFSLFNSIGQKIATKEIMYPGGEGLQTFKPNVDFIQGVYNLEILKPNGDIKTLKVLK